jgi:hypothetical protein
MDQMMAEHLLAEWRDCERQLAATDPTSGEASRLAARCEELRDEYQRIVKAEQRLPETSRR